MIKKNQNLILKVLKCGLLFVIFFLPFAVTPWTIYPFVFGKTLFFQSAIELLLAFYIVLLIISPVHRPRFDTLTVIVLAYFGIIFLASIFGIDFLHSFWGTEERGMGLFTQLHFLVFFLMLRSVFNEEKHRNRAFIVAVISGLLLSIVALLRLRGVLLFGVDLGFRLSGTLANPLFFAAILIFYLFFSLYFVLRVNRLPLKIFYASAAVGFFAMILATQSRGALIASMAGVVFFLIVSALKSLDRRVRIAAGATLASLTVLGAVIWVTPDVNIWKKVTVIRRLQNIRDTTGSTRLMAWNIAFKAFREKPILGWGNENFNIAFSKYYDPGLLKYGYQETWWDRPHNIILEILVNSGVIGLISYGVILVYAASRFLRQGRTAVMLCAGLVAYFIQNLFVFDTPSSLLLFYLLLSGVDVKLEDRSLKLEEHKSQITNYKLQTNSKSLIPYYLFLIPVELVAAGLMIYKLNWQPMVASAAMLQAAVYAADYSDVRSIALFRAALTIPTPYKEETRLQVGQIITGILSKQSIPPEKFREFFDFAEQEIKANITLHPKMAYYHFMLGRLYTESLNYDNSYADAVVPAFTRALELSPNRQQILFGLAKFFFDQGRIDEAGEIYRKAIEAEPQVGEAHWFYAAVLMQQGKKELAEKEMIEAANLGHMPPQAEEQLLFARLMAREKNYHRVVDYLEAVLRSQPNRVDLLAQVAVAYKEVAKKEVIVNVKLAKDYVAKARRAATRAAELDQSFAAEAEIFLKSLPSY